MQLWLVPRTQPDTRVQRPVACPHAGCDGRRFRLHQAVAKRVRGAAGRPVAAHRYTCRACRRTFRAYPAGVDRGTVAVGVKRFAAALHLLGLPFRDVSRALAVLGAPLGKSQVQAVVAPRLRGLRHRSIAPLVTRVTLAGVGVADAREGDRDGRAPDPDAAGAVASVWVHGRSSTLRRAVDRHGRAALVIDDIDRRGRLAVEQWVRATLAGFGVDVEVVFPAAPHRRCATAGEPVGDGGCAIEAAVVGAGSAVPAVCGAPAPIAPAPVADPPPRPYGSSRTACPAAGAWLLHGHARQRSGPAAPCPDRTRCRPSASRVLGGSGRAPHGHRPRRRRVPIDAPGHPSFGRAPERRERARPAPV